MANLQPSYGVQARLLVGQIANEEKYNAISRTVESAAGIAFGQPAFRGSGDHGVIAGATFAATGAAVAYAGNTGNATVGTITVSGGASQGVYNIRFDTATTYTVTNAASGAFVGRGSTGVAFNTGGLAFTITAGGTPMVAGDGFALTVTYTSNNMFMGFAVLDPAVLTVTANPDFYAQYEAGSFMLSGQTAVTAGASVVDGDPVYWNPATQRYTNSTAHVRIPGAYFDTTGVNGDTVEVSVGNRRVVA